MDISGFPKPDVNAIGIHIQCRLYLLVKFVLTHNLVIKNKIINNLFIAQPL